MPIPDFDYYCARCDAPFCERVHIMNLALDNLDDEYCLDCLCADQEQPREAFLSFIRGYVQSRDCFLTPWLAFDPTLCPAQGQSSPYPCLRC